MTTLPTKPCVYCGALTTNVVVEDDDDRDRPHRGGAWHVCPACIAQGYVDDEPATSSEQVEAAEIAIEALGDVRDDLAATAEAGTTTRHDLLEAAQHAIGAALALARAAVAGTPIETASERTWIAHIESSAGSSRYAEHSMTLADALETLDPSAVSCAGCDEVVLEGDATQVGPDEYYCEHCLAEAERVECAGCGESILEVDAEPFSGGEYLCEECLNDPCCDERPAPAAPAEPSGPSAEMRERMAAVAQRVWSAVASDLIACTEECGETWEDDPEVIAECVLDADRPLSFGEDREAALAFESMPYRAARALVIEALGYSEGA